MKNYNPKKTEVKMQKTARVNRENKSTGKTWSKNEEVKNQSHGAFFSTPTLLYVSNKNNKEQKKFLFGEFFVNSSPFYVSRKNNK
jgi:hypothetical protein